MAKVGVRLKIDVSKIEKARLFKGEKGTYLDATVFINLDELDQYGNSGMITQDVNSKERESGVNGAILGNCKVFWSDGVAKQQPQQQQQQGYAPQQQQQQQQQQQGYAPQPQQQQQGYAPQPQQPPLKQPSQGGMQMPAGDGWDDDIPF